MKDKGGDDDSDSSSDSDSSDDNEAAFNPRFDEEFFKTLSSLKRKDDTIYEKSTKFFEEEDILHVPSYADDKERKKKLTIKQYEQDILLKSGGIYDQDDEDGINNSKMRPQSPTYNEEQQMIKDEFKHVLQSDDSDEDENVGGLFVKHEKTKEEEVIAHCL